MQRFVHSKWSKTQALTGDSRINGHIPHTEKLSREALGDMLGRYGMVYVKPDKGTFGNGVMRVEKTDSGYRYQNGLTVKTFDTKDDLYEDLVKATRNRTYLIQKGIHLLKHKGSRFDIRVMVQMSPGGKWETTGIIGRVADPRKVVTNVHNGGTLVEVPALMKPYLDREGTAAFQERLRRMGVRVARRLNSRYPGLKEIGIDVAVDRSLQPWILEVNTCPDPYIFRKLKDRSVFRRVYRYAVAYGRIKRSKK